MKLSVEDGTLQYPMVHFDEKLIDHLSLPWKDALVVKIVGLYPSFTAMWKKLKVA